MKRIRIITLVVLMLSMVAFIPYASIPNHEIRRPRHTPSPTPTATAAPLNGATVSGDVTLVWSAVSGAARYHLQAGLGTSFDEKSNFIDNWSLTSPSYTFTVTPGLVVYFPHLYWRVQAIDANNVQGPWSAVWYMILTSP